MKTKITNLCTGIIVITLSSLTMKAQVFVNGGFEQGLTGWTTFGNAFGDDAYAESGTNALKIYGNWSTPGNATGAYQALPAAAGQTWTLEGFGLDPAEDAVAGTNQNFALLKLVWFDGPNGTGNALQPMPGPGAAFGAYPGVESERLNAQTPLGTWVRLSASGVAPAGTASVQIFGGLFIQPNFEGGSLWFDSETVTVVPEPGNLAINVEGANPNAG